MAQQVHITYRTTCSVTGRFYVGMHSTTLLNDGYMGSGNRITHSLKKHGKAAHTFKVLGFYPDRVTLKEAEKALITPDLLADPMCMNLAPGGGGGRLPGFNHTEATRAKIAANSGSHRAEVRAKISATLTGRKSPAHSTTQLNRFADISNHPRTKSFLLVSPDGEEHAFLGVVSVGEFCRQHALSLGALFNHFNRAVGVITKAKAVGRNTVGWSLREQA
jgi:hypothetical protein